MKLLFKCLNKSFFCLFCVWSMLFSVSFAQTKNAVPGEVASVFNTAASITQETTSKDFPWYKVYDSKKQLLGYVAYSKPASDGITGFAGETPLMVAFDTKRKIKSVVLLENDETPSFVNRVKKGGLFECWNGMSIQQALKKQPDVISGATYTSKSVIASFHALLNRLDKESQTGSRWMWGAGGGVLGLLLIVVVRRRKGAQA